MTNIWMGIAGKIISRQCFWAVSSHLFENLSVINSWRWHFVSRVHKRPSLYMDTDQLQVLSLVAECLTHWQCNPVLCAHLVQKPKVCDHCYRHAGTELWSLQVVFWAQIRKVRIARYVDLIHVIEGNCGLSSLKRVNFTKFSSIQIFKNIKLY